MNRQTHPKRKGDIPVTSAGLDEFELGLLSVARHFIISFAAPDTQSWTIALNIASERWGISEGARAAVSLLAVIEAMRRARRSMFHFSDPNCPTCRETLTPNERHLMLMIHAIRQGQIGQAQTEAMLLCEGEDTTDLMRAAWGLAGLFPGAKLAVQAPKTAAFETIGSRLH